MLIQINSDRSVENNQRTIDYFETTIQNTLQRFSDQITRIVVHLSDENGDKESQNDKRCLIEARLKGLEPIALTHNADSLEKAVSGAADRLKKTLDHTLSKVRQA